MPSQTTKQRILVVASDNFRRDWAVRMHLMGCADVYLLTLKKMDRLDIIADNDISAARVWSLAELYTEQAILFKRRGTKAATEDIRNWEQKGCTSFGQLLSYNMSRNMVPGMREDDYVSRIWSEYNIMNQLLETIRPDVCLGELSRSYYVVLHDVAAVRQIPFLSPIDYDAFFFPQPTMFMFDINGRIIGLEDRYHSYVNDEGSPTEEAAEFPAGIEKHVLQRSTFTPPNLSTTKSLFRKLAYRVTHLKNWLNSQKIDRRFFYDSLEFGNGISAIYKRFFIRKIRYWATCNLSALRWKGLNKRPSGEKYIYFPLHFYPEVVSSVFANKFIHHFQQEQHLIQWLAKSLPAGYKLYVKEHKNMMHNRSWQFYSEVASIPNVRLFHANAHGFDLLDHANLIVTINSTTGLEGIIRRRPVLTFHGVYYRGLAQVKTVDLNMDLNIQLQDALATQLDESARATALAALYDSGCPIQFEPCDYIPDYSYRLNDQGVGDLAFMIANISNKWHQSRSALATGER